MSGIDAPTQKRVRTDDTDDVEARPTKAVRADTTANVTAGAAKDLRSQEHHNGRRNRSGPRDRQVQNERPKGRPTLFTQASTICVGDRGIFVTCDKGREKKCLQDLRDIVQDMLELDETNNETEGDGNSADDVKPQVNAATALKQIEDVKSIEQDIEAELAGMRGTGNGRPGYRGESTPSKPMMDMILLDIPCVGLLRFSSRLEHDPVVVVKQICEQAAAAPHNPRSRYVKRLTPISTLGKTLSEGLENVCEQVLPKYFEIAQGQSEGSIKYAVRPTVRNNDKLERMAIINTVASYVQKYGHGQHKVDLKGYQKGVLVEVYRGWVGICVVDNEATAKGAGYEALRRYNLAEIYAEAQSSKT